MEVGGCVAGRPGDWDGFRLNLGRAEARPHKPLHTIGGAADLHRTRCVWKGIVRRKFGGVATRSGEVIVAGELIAANYCAAAAEVATPSSFSFARARRSSSVPG
jgi:hypothetical protein